MTATLVKDSTADATAGGALDETTAALERKGVRDPARWAATLVAAVLDAPHVELPGRRAQALTDAQTQRLRDLVGQVTPDAPVAYLVGRAPFLDGDYEVTRDTLICKPDTELFVELVLAQIGEEPLPPRPHVLELCAGSGCVAITFARRLPGACVVATDISPEALAVAQRNVARYGLEHRVALGQGDLCAPLPSLSEGRPFDLIVSNPPYIPTDQIAGMGRHVAEHEPRLALDGGADGLDPHRRILADALPFLAPGGRMFLEHEHYHGSDARALAARHPEYENIHTFPDASGKDRALFVRRRA